MPSFRTAYEQKKWDSIGRSEKAALDRMGRGEGTPDDVKALQQMIVRFHSLVTETFRASVWTLNRSAEQRIQRIVDDRERKGKEPLDENAFATLLDLALHRAWLDQGSEIAVLLESELEKSRVQQNEELEGMLGRQFEKYKKPEVDREQNQKLLGVAHQLTEEEEPKDLVGQQFNSVTEDMTLPLSEKLIQQANESYEVTSDLRDATEELVDPNKQERKHKERMIGWLRMFKGSLVGKTVRKTQGFFGSLLGLIGKVLAVELLGGRLWESMSQYFTLDNLQKMGSEVLDTGLGLMAKGWDKLSSYISFDNIKKLVNTALDRGLEGLGMIGRSIKKFLGFESEPDPVPQPSTIAPPTEERTLWQRAKDWVSQPAAEGDTVVGPELTTNISVPGPGTPEVQETSGGLTKSEVEPTNEMLAQTGKSEAMDPMSSRGAGAMIGPSRLPDRQTAVEDPKIDLGQDNAVTPETQQPAESGAAGSSSSATGGVKSSMFGFSWNQGIDGTLGAMNLGMLTS